MPAFISIVCPSCGGKLDVYPDMDVFACGYCGSNLQASRRGGALTLKALTEAIRKVQLGTDKTAAELAIARLRPELEGGLETGECSSNFPLPIVDVRNRGFIRFRLGDFCGTCE